MKISNDESLRAGRIESVSPVPSGSVKTSPAATPGTGPAAQIELSAHAQALAASKAANKAEAARFLPAVQAAPETRDDLVSRLKTQVASGSYHVPSSDIADQIVRRAKADQIQ